MLWLSQLAIVGRILACINPKPNALLLPPLPYVMGKYCAKLPGVESWKMFETYHIYVVLACTQL